LSTPTSAKKLIVYHLQKMYLPVSH